MPPKSPFACNYCPLFVALNWWTKVRRALAAKKAHVRAAEERCWRFRPEALFFDRGFPAFLATEAIRR
jgi:hypothetical protein